MARNVALIALLCVAEGGWLAVGYTIVQVFVGVEPVLGLAHFAAAAATGSVTGLLPIRRARGVLLGVVVVTASIAGLLLHPAARAAVDGPGGYVNLVLTHPGGILAGAAVARGLLIARDRDGEPVRLSLWTIPLVAVPWVLIGLAQPRGGDAAVGVALAGTVAFVTALLMATVFASLDPGRGTAPGDASRRQLAWAVTLLASAGLLWAIGLSVGATLAAGSRWIFRAVTLHSPVPEQVGIASFLPTPIPRPSATGTLLPNPVAPVVPAAPGGPPVELGWILIVVGVAVAFLIARLALRLIRARRAAHRPRMLRRRKADAARDERAIDASPRTGPPRAVARPTEAPPTGAGSVEQAYLEVLRAFEQQPALARRTHETPAAHSARLRAAGVGSHLLDLLAADFELARYGGREISSAESRRAVRRSDWLRRHRPGSSGAT